MYDFQRDAINRFIDEAKTKEKVLAGLKVLKQHGIDPLYPKESPIWRYLSNHVFRVLIADSPTQSEKEYLKNLWNNFNPEGKQSLQYDCIETTFGRSLLASVLDDKLLFETIINKGILAELTAFIKNKPDFFKRHTDLKIFQYPLKKIILCEEAGLKINFNILINTVSDNYKVKVPSKLFDFIKRHKDKVTLQEWDQIIFKFLENIKSTNYLSAWNNDEPFIGDVFSLVESLNFPKELKIEETVHLCSYFSVCTNINLLDTKNKNLSSDEINNRWLNSILSLNTMGFIKSDLWDKFYSLLDNDFIVECIKNSSDVIKKYDKRTDYNTSNYPLGLKYFKLMDNESFRPILLDMIFEHGSVQTNKKVYNNQKGNPGTASREYMYRFYINKLLDNPKEFTKIESISGNNFNDEMFKEFKQAILMERDLPDKKQDSLIMKI